MKRAIVVAVSAVTAASAIAASVATADPTRVASPAAPNCKLATIALTGPYTGPAGGAGLDQRGWGRVFLTNWNAGRAIPGVPRGLQAHEAEGHRGRYAAEPAGRRDRRGAAAVEQGRARRQRVLR